MGAKSYSFERCESEKVHLNGDCVLKLSFREVNLRFHSIKFAFTPPLARSRRCEISDHKTADLSFQMTSLSTVNP